MASLLSRIATSMWRARPATDGHAVPAADSPPIDATIQAAIEHRDAGRLDRAEAIYRQLLASGPDDFEILHQLGAVCYEQGNATEALPFMHRAIALRPTDHAAHGNLGAALFALDQLDAAQGALTRALDLAPDSDVICNLMGAVLRARGDVAGARSHFEKALALNSRNAEAANNLGNLAKEAGDIPAAEGYYRLAVQLNPRFADAYSNLGGLYQRQGDLEKAEEVIRQALEIRPDNADALNNLGGVLQERGDLDAAEECLRAALRVHPDLPPAMHNLGTVLRMMGRLQEAERYCRRALEIDPTSAAAVNNLATVLGQRGDLDAAERACRDALRLDPSCAPAYSNLGSIFRERGDMRTAEASYRDALRIDPGHPHIEYDLSILALLQENYEEGFELYESRFHCAGRDFAATRNSHRKLAAVPLWRGEPLSGKRIYIWSEQGLGDTLMVMRYLPLLRARGALHLSVQCDPALERVVASMSEVDEVIARSDAVPDDRTDFHCSMMSLPHRFGTRIGNVPNTVPYLHVPDTLAAEFAKLMRGITKPRVGLAWAGNRTLRDDARRSIPLKQFAALFRHPQIQLMSLQKGEAAKDWIDLAKTGSEFIERCEDFMDTAALVTNLDLVVTVDTAVAHLAGALGKPVWLLNRFGSEWRWGLEREDSPWYPTMMQFRQRGRGHWGETIDRVGQAMITRWPR
ncbi:MAG: tetratricopeptide repeat protein [Casimicrobiaceae bacterium]